MFAWPFCIANRCAEARKESTDLEQPGGHPVFSQRALKFIERKEVRFCESTAKEDKSPGRCAGRQTCSGREGFQEGWFLQSLRNLGRKPQSSIRQKVRGARRTINSESRGRNPGPGRRAKSQNKIARNCWLTNYDTGQVNSNGAFHFRNGGVAPERATKEPRRRRKAILQNGGEGSRLAGRNSPF